MRVPRAYTSCGPLTAPTNRHLTGNVNSGFAPGTLPTTDANIASSRVIIVSYSCILGMARPRKGARPPPLKAQFAPEQMPFHRIIPLAATVLGSG